MMFPADDWSCLCIGMPQTHPDNLGMNLSTRETTTMKSPFSCTLSVLLASLSADAECRELRQPVPSHFDFQLMAAATSASPALPEAAWMDLSRLLSITVSQDQNDLVLTVQAQGFAALQRVAGRQARLDSADGLLRIPFGFDATGTGRLQLADQPEVRDALRHHRIVLTPLPA